jgi:DNA processing protein
LTEALSSEPSCWPAPQDQADEIHWLQLIRSRRVGPATFQRLMREYASPAEALAALPGIANAAGVKSYTVFPAEAATQEFRTAKACGARMICLGSKDYPHLLAEIPDAPPLFWAKGQTDLLARPDMVAIVGARNASSLGTRMAKALAHDLAEAGFAVVSGLARGIDTAAHLAAMDGGTIAVMAGGIDYVYPRENAGLAADIATKGLLISEQMMGLVPQARHFPRRTRISSGLCRAVIVVEGAAKSGSLITAREALDQGREVMAVPGHPFDARASGCNNLLRDGATLVRSARDVIEALQGGRDVAAVTTRMDESAPVPVVQSRASSPVNQVRANQDALDLSRRILSLLSPTPVAEDQLIRALDLPAQMVSPELVTLEMEGKLARQSGGMLSLAV